MPPRAYTVKQLAAMAEVSVRTLHHYDDVGLLAPSARSAAGYRLYEEKDLLRLQQILFFRELDMSLEIIRTLLDRPGFDFLAALETHRDLLAARVARLSRLMDTVDATIDHLKGARPMADQALYEGFSTQDIEALTQEAHTRWGHTPAWQQSQARVHRLGKEGMKRVMEEGAAVDAGVAEAMRQGAAPDSAGVAALMARKVDHLRAFYEPTADLFEGLGRLYVEDPRFQAHYDAIAPGLADFLCRAMAHHARTSM